ncbi:MAG: replication initiation factor domain-containing protein [Phycisphaerales bacterium]
MTSPQPNTVIHPRIVTPGIETQNPLDQVPERGMSCRPDWIRLVGPECSASEVIQLLEEAFGESTGSNNGAMYFREGMQWHPGVLYSSGHNSAKVMVDLQGSRLATMCVPGMMELTFQIMMLGFRCSRIDLAVDHVGMNYKLHQHALDSCKSGELCKIRTFADDSEFKADGTPQRYLLKLGKRDSSVCARLYDKGLETKTLQPGQWERLEVEFKDDRAAEVCMTLVDAGVRLPEALWRYVIGAIDFRMVNGRTELNRRPRADWWDQYVGQGHPLETKPIKKESSFATWCGWFRTSVGPRLLQLSSILGMQPQELFEQLIHNLDPATTTVPATVEAEQISCSLTDIPR